MCILAVFVLRPTIQTSEAQGIVMVGPGSSLHAPSIPPNASSPVGIPLKKATFTTS